MQASNALQMMLIAKHAGEDPGDAGHLVIDRDRFYYTLVPSTTETRTLDAPPQPGLVGHIGTTETQTVVVTVKDSGGSTTGTITLTTAGQWIGLVSVELSTGVYSWQATDVYGCSTTVQTAQNWSAAVAAGTMTTLVVSTSIAAASVLGTNISASSGSAINMNVQTGLTVGSTAVMKSVNATTVSAASCYAPVLSATNAAAGTVGVSSNLTAANLTAGSGGFTSNMTAANLTAGTANVSSNFTAANVTIGSKLVEGVSVVATTGGTTNSDALAIGNAPVALLSAGATAAGLFYKLPAAAVGLACNVVNLNTVSAQLINANSTNSVAGATSVTLAANTGAAPLVCDGTQWWRIA